MSVQKTKRLSLVDQVAMQIEQLIESGYWSVGDKLPPEPQLMEQFEVSRNTLREAIRALVHTGFLETRQGIGTLVTSASNLEMAFKKKIKKSKLLETLEVRLTLEREAAQLACERRTEQDLSDMAGWIERCRAAAETQNFSEFIEMDIAFHKAVVRATHNQMFVELYDHITEALEQSVHELLLRTAAQHGYDIHTDLFEAIERQDVDTAVRSINAYMNQAQDALAASMNKLESPS
ncbi:FadR/GntR family transcriptional regulator [Paenibacillus hodogayensis]|uniref:FadR/GntR family transcriptional regulator n=1 Tax=Paenibacillus hodogayensis TaxID=279208 RepID=A0ABV5W1D7_9BACL